jgi:hypothetical protein
MPKFKNVSPLGALDLPLIGRVVEAGEIIEVTTARAKFLKGQTDTWKPMKGSTTDDDHDPDDPAGDGNTEAPTGEQGDN